MHFHLPKPLHGWREFAGEVGIIVVGVLIALGAEQLVETIHWRDNVAEARQQLRYEVGDNLKLLAWRNQANPCIERRLDELGIILNKAAVDGRLPSVGPIGNPVTGLYPTGVWQSQMSAQTGTHFSAGQLAALSRIYRGIDIVRQRGDEERDAWLMLNTMVGPGRPITPTTIDRLASALIIARADNRSVATMQKNIDGVLAQGTLGDHFPQMDPLNRFKTPPYSNNSSICRPIAKDAPPIYGMAGPYNLPRSQQLIPGNTK